MQMASSMRSTLTQCSRCGGGVVDVVDGVPLVLLLLLLMRISDVGTMAVGLVRVLVFVDSSGGEVDTCMVGWCVAARRSDEANNRVSLWQGPYLELIRLSISSFVYRRSRYCMVREREREIKGDRVIDVYKAVRAFACI